MSLESFLHHLHVDVDEIIPADWDVNWEDAPTKFKLYRGLPVFPLSAEVPLTLEGEKMKGTVNLQEIGHFLWYAYGLTQLCCLDYTPMLRRFVPSGGALYPSELYLYLKLPELPAGMYHYDAAHHRLVLLRAGDYDRYLTRALGHRCDLSRCFGAVFVATRFWKNFFKYNNFAYRLQGLDAGVLLGQMLEVAKRFGFETGVCFQFLDRAILHLLGLSEQEESVYAIAPLSLQPVSAWFADSHQPAGQVETAPELCGELPAVQHETYERSQTVLEYPMLVKMNEASLWDSTESFRLFGKTSASNPTEPTNAANATNPAEPIESAQSAKPFGPPVKMPPVNRLSYDLTEVSRNRFSPAENFVLKKVSLSQLTALLHEAFASFSYCNDLDVAGAKRTPRVSLYGCFYGIDDLPNGAYRYDSELQALQPILPGVHRFDLQQGMTMHTVNLSQAPFCFHVVGERDHYTTTLGIRGYRIQQMEAGMLVQKLLLAASALAMGGHPLLDFDTRACDTLYQLAPIERTALIQIPVGFYRVRPQLQGRLRC